MIRFRPNGNVVCLKLLQLIVFLLIPIFSFAAVSGANGFVEVSTSCSDVLSIKGIDKDFHLLVTNASVSALVDVSAHNPPYRLVLPANAQGTVSVGKPLRYEVVKAPGSKGLDTDLESDTSGWIIMFCPGFSVKSDAPSDIAATGIYELTDNFTAKVSVDPNGISNLLGHDPQLDVIPVESGEKINHDFIFDISVFVDEASNIWPTTRTFWYGLKSEPMGCCNKNRFYYKFCLKVDGFICQTKFYTVGWPRNEPAFVEPRPNIRGLIGYGYLMEHCEGNPKGNYRAELLLQDYPKGIGYFSGLPDVSQYAVETQKEEDYHQKQWLGLVSLNKGGMQDLFTACGACHFERNSPEIDSDGYVYGDSEEDVETSAVNALKLLEDLEFMTSYHILDGDARRNFREYHAKAHASYNAAWKYHCTYGRGKEQEPVNEIHPAFR